MIDRRLAAPPGPSSVSSHARVLLFKVLRVLGSSVSRRRVSCAAGEWVLVMGKGSGKGGGGGASRGRTASAPAPVAEGNRGALLSLADKAALHGASMLGAKTLNHATSGGPATGSLAGDGTAVSSHGKRQAAPAIPSARQRFTRPGSCSTVARKQTTSASMATLSREQRSSSPATTRATSSAAERREGLHPWR